MDHIIFFDCFGSLSSLKGNTRNPWKATSDLEKGITITELKQILGSSMMFYARLKFLVCESYVRTLEITVVLPINLDDDFTCIWCKLVQ